MEVTVYTAPTCPRCDSVKNLLDENNVEYEEKDVSNDDAYREELMGLTGYSSVPATYIATDDGEYVVLGYNKESLSNKLGL